jgi:hypothetical protein
LALASLAGWLAPSAAAAGTSWSLEWSAPQGCPSEQTVRETVEAWLAQGVEANHARGIHVEAEVKQTARGFALELSLETPSGQSEEQLVAERCETLAGVVALKVALAADPGAWFEAASGESARRARPWGARLSAGLSQGLQPGVGPHLALTGSWQIGPAAFELGAGYGLPNEARYAAHPEIGAKLDLLYGSARACVLPNVGSLAFPICAGADVGVMRGQGFGLADTSTSAQSFASLVLGPALRWPLSELVHVWLGLDALVPLVRPQYHVRNLDRLFRPEPIGARVQLGSELRF